MVFVYISSGDNAAEIDTGIGKTVPLHATAAGKAILAEFSDERVSQIISEQDLERITTNTITDREQLFSELEEIRARGYSQNDQERVPDVRAVGVPITSPSDQVIGALSVAGPSHRLVDELFHEDLPNLLLGTANEIELKIKYS